MFKTWCLHWKCKMLSNKVIQFPSIQLIKQYLHPSQWRIIRVHMEIHREHTLKFSIFNSKHGQCQLYRQIPGIDIMKISKEQALCLKRLSIWIEHLQVNHLIKHPLKSECVCLCGGVIENRHTRNLLAQLGWSWECLAQVRKQTNKLNQTYNKESCEPLSPSSKIFHILNYNAFTPALLCNVSAWV